MLIDFEKQLNMLRKDKTFLKSENTVLKESNENNQYVIMSLNKALEKANSRIKLLEEKTGLHEQILRKDNEQAYEDAKKGKDLEVKN